ncbi:MAG: ATP-binding cassette domain-containing protein, partial [Verrucomicrobia bacterium]|nr:ATP-binding cassette domain-containing protein [Verrucomicrobiota bacterium]
MAPRVGLHAAGAPPRPVAVGSRAPRAGRGSSCHARLGVPARRLRVVPEARPVKAALEWRGVAKRFGRTRALDGFSLEVPAGSITGLVGSNGAGKTTAMAIAGGMTMPDAGVAIVFGEGPFDPDRHAGRLSLLPQDSE